MSESGALGRDVRQGQVVYHQVDQFNGQPRGQPLGAAARP
jgi:hypothetical protein